MGKGGSDERGYSSRPTTDKELLEQRLDSLREWQGTFNPENIQSTLREGKKVTGKAKILQDNLDALMQPTEKEQTVYRIIAATNSETEQSLLDAAREGKTFPDGGYVATSSDLSEINFETFQTQGPEGKPAVWVAKVTIPKGTDVIDVNKMLGEKNNNYSSEKEILIHRGGEFKVSNPDLNKKWVDLKVIK